jgi:thymidylate synthase ThyX
MREKEHRSSSKRETALGDIVLMEFPKLRKELEIPRRFSFPYQPEKFTSKEKRILNTFFTNCDQPVFAIYNLPQEVVGAMFSRYSRSEKSVRRLFLDEFWSPEFSFFTGDRKKLAKAQQRTENFYKRVFAEFGDDSVIQMGSVHIAFEFVSQIAAKAIEDQRIGASHIEKSTRYVNFGNKVGNHFLFMEVPEIMHSPYAKEYKKWNDLAFNLYNRNLPVATDFLKQKYPLEEQVFENSAHKEFRFGEIQDPVEKEKIKKAYERAVKAKAFDLIRIFLPTTTVTNLGAHFSGQAAENTLNKLLSSPYSEVRHLGLSALRELTKVVPNFLQNITNHHGEIVREYRSETRLLQEKTANKWVRKIKPKENDADVRLVSFDKNALIQFVAQILYTAQKKTYYSKTEILKAVKKLSFKKLQEILSSSFPDRSQPQYNRRHKLPRAFEHAFAEVEFFKDFGIYRDLQRNRLSSTERLALNPEDLEIPVEFKEKGMEKVLEDYLKLHKTSQILYRKLIKKAGLRSAAEYVTLLGHKLRFNVKANLRQWVFFSELRTIAGGHPSYRNAMQKAVREITRKLPELKNLFAKVNWVRSYGLGRLKAEITTQEKLAQIKK